MNLQEKDRKYVWHPFTQEQMADLPIPIVRGSGAYLFDENGKEYIDLVSSWWVNLHGHAHPAIAKAIYEQASSLEHVLFAGFTHEPAVKLCEKLSSILPKNLSRFFFSDNGSTAVEVALKMSYQYWKNKGQQKRSIFLSFDGGYHGDTFGAMSVGRSSGFHDQFKELLFTVKTIPYPQTLAEEQTAMEVLDKHLAQHAHEIAAFITEPLIQGASGMRHCRKEFLEQVVTKIREHEILIIFDEVMTGFGRTGTNFAFEQLNLTPDFMCLSKGLTGGFLPLALTIVGSHIYDAFLDSNINKAFLHGHSYTANPLGCAAACASLDILLSEETKKQIKLIEQINKQRITAIENVFNPRVLGTIASFDHRFSANLKQLFLDAGLLLRPLGNTVYLMPPYCIGEKVLHGVYDKINSILKRLV